MQEILSKDNKKIKYCMNLSKKKYRDQEGKFVVEGMKQVLEAVSLNYKIDFILIRDDVYDIKTSDGDFAFMKLQEKEQLIRVKRDIFESISSTETNQGILAVVYKREFAREDFMEAGNYLLLDQVQDPGNVGTLIRTAEGAGYKGIILVKGTADIFAPKIVRAAGGAVMRTAFLQVDDYEELRGLFESMNKKLVVTDLIAKAWYYEEDISKDVILALGNEGNGVSEEVKDMADVRVKIPMSGSLESLNVAVAGGILMYEAVRNKTIGD